MFDVPYTAFNCSEYGNCLTCFIYANFKEKSNITNL